ATGGSDAARFDGATGGSDAARFDGATGGSDAARFDGATGGSEAARFGGATGGSEAARFDGATGGSEAGRPVGATGGPKSARVVDRLDVLGIEVDRRLRDPDVPERDHVGRPERDLRRLEAALRHLRRPRPRPRTPLAMRLAADRLEQVGRIGAAAVVDRRRHR